MMFRMGKPNKLIKEFINSNASRESNLDKAASVLSYHETCDRWRPFSWLQAGQGADWWSEETVAVVTGANRGIGLEICRQLAGKGLTVIMTARKPQEQLSSSAQLFLQEAAETGRKNVVFHTLDITQQQSVMDFADWLKLNFGFVDILINNAGVLKSIVDWEFLVRNTDMAADAESIVADPIWADGFSEEYELAKEGIETNYYGTKGVTKALLPLLRPSPYKPRIVIVSSVAGLLKLMRDEGLREQLSDAESLTEAKIDEVAELFLEDLKKGEGMEKWPTSFSSYSVSKIAVNAYTRMLALQLQGKACINCVHPGGVNTDMSQHLGPLSATEGAENVVRVALFPAGGPSGHNFLENQDSEF